MFLLIPLSIFILSSIIVLYISLRKFAYLKKLNTNSDSSTVEMGEVSFSQFMCQMFPEVFDYFRKVDVAAHKSSFLLEFEKFLRKIRLAFLKVDNVSNNLIHKIRATHIQEAQKSQEKIEAQKLEDMFVNEVSVMTEGQEDFKKKEHELIIEIAKNPKNPILYKSLGDLYIKTEQWEYAKESFLSAIKLDPTIKGIKRKLELANKMSSHGH